MGSDAGDSSSRTRVSQSTDFLIRKPQLRLFNCVGATIGSSLESAPTVSGERYARRTAGAKDPERRYQLRAARYDKLDRGRVLVAASGRYDLALFQFAKSGEDTGLHLVRSEKLCADRTDESISPAFD
jgi:hypothetical protein